MKKALYPGSFDPATLGHTDAIQRAANQCDQLIVAVGENLEKDYMFSFSERVHLITGCTKSIEESGLNIKIQPFSGLLVDFAFQQGISTIIKGVRGPADLEYEQMLHSTGETQDLGIETLLLFAAQDKTHISSSATKAILKDQGDISKFVTLNVKHALESRMMEQYIVGVTGTIGAGKSYITEQLGELGKTYHIPVHDIDLDKIGHYILGEGMEPGYVEIRKKIAREFGKEVLDTAGFVERPKLGAIVFGNEEKRKKLDQILETAIQLQTRQEMREKKGIMLLNGALLAEIGNTDANNNNTVLIGVDKEVQAERLSNRGYDSEEIERRISSQYTSEKKKSLLDSYIEEKDYGTLIDFENNGNNTEQIEEMFIDMVNTVDIYGELRMQGVLQELGLEDQFLKLYSLLKKHYDSVERAYHNWSHIVSCLDHLYKIKNDISPQGFLELFFAFIFHDVIYDAKAKGGKNESDSAVFAEKILTELQVPGLDISRVVHLIEITANHEADGNNIIDAYMIDIDMSILGTDWETYLRYTQQIRSEYSVYSDEEYIAGRTHFLKGQLGKKIFLTEYYYETYQEQGQENIAKEIAMLEAMALS